MTKGKSPTTATSQLLKTLHFERGIAVERQVVKHLRGLILQGKLVPHTRIPPIRTLAKSWNTNYFTIQAALRQLVRERLLVQSPKLGTFVGSVTRKLSRVCLYHSRVLGSNNFYGQLNIQIYRLLSERGVTSFAYFDSRTEKQKKTIPPELEVLLKEREIDGLIVSAFSLVSAGWLNRIQVPASLILTPGSLARFGEVRMDMNRFGELAVQSTLKARRKRVGVISFDAASKVNIQKQAAAKGLDVVNPARPPSSEEYSLEEFGFRQCEQFLAMKRPPDSLICFPDDCTRGVVNSLLQRGIKVPKDLLVISHQNQEMPLFSPFPIQRINVRVEDFAQALITQLDNQIEGKKPSPLMVVPQIAD